MIDLNAILTSIVSAIVTSKYFLLYLAYAFALGFIFWLLWVTLNVANALKKRLFFKVLFWLLIIPGALIDVIFNLTVGTAIFLEFPKESTLSMRMTRYLSGKAKDKITPVDYGYRVKLAEYISRTLVEPWGNGHIGLVRFGYEKPRNALAATVRWIKGH